jgi:hypothetical protein
MGHSNDKSSEQGQQPLQGLPAALYGRYCGAPESDPNLFTPFLAAVPKAQDVNSCAAPAENYVANTLTAQQKHHYPWPKLAVLGVLAGERGSQWKSAMGGQGTLAGSRRHSRHAPLLAEACRMPSLSWLLRPAGLHCDLLTAYRAALQDP